MSEDTMGNIEIALECIEKYCDTGLVEELDQAICELQNEAYECRKKYMQGNLPGVVENANEEKYGKGVKKLIIRSKALGTHETLVDIEDWDRVKTHRWGLSQSAPGAAIYAMYNRGGKWTWLHRFIVNAPDDMVTDHANGNSLDNRKVNLRVCTAAQNARNKRMFKNNVSGYRGVSFRPKAKGKKRWEARANLTDLDNVKKNHYLGLFETAKEAAQARDAFVREMRGDCEFTRYNFPEGEAEEK